MHFCPVLSRSTSILLPIHSSFSQIRKNPWKLCNFVKICVNNWWEFMKIKWQEFSRIKPHEAEIVPFLYRFVYSKTKAKTTTIENDGIPIKGRDCVLIFICLCKTANKLFLHFLYRFKGLNCTSFQEFTTIFQKRMLTKLINLLRTRVYFWEFNSQKFLNLEIFRKFVNFGISQISENFRNFFF